MHYVRLLRPPKLSRKGKKHIIELLFTITTDLGDSFLFSEDSLELTAEAFVPSDLIEKSWIISQEGELSWQPGMRVLKSQLAVPEVVAKSLYNENDQVKFCVSATKERSAGAVSKILETSSDASREDASDGLVMPVWVTMGPENTNVSMTRKLSLDIGMEEFIEVEEDIGESIARHIWDAGVVALCAIAGTFALPSFTSSQHSCMRVIKSILSSRETLNILELGCGVGVLGAGIASAYTRIMPHEVTTAGCSILMTDLEEAESRARSNMLRIKKEPADDPGNGGPAELLYENLDWEDGRQGRFGPQLRSRRWDLVILSDCTYNVDMLPALVETLSAVHRANMAHGSAGQRPTTKVFLATKPRHESERALFDLLRSHGWSTLEKQILPLPVLGAEAQSVELYLFQKL